MYLSREQLDVHLARLPITFLIFCVLCEYIYDCSAIQQYKSNYSLAGNQPAISPGFGADFVCFEQLKSMSGCVRSGIDLIHNQVFSLTKA